jgi:type VI secretion system protein ImpJ
MNDANRVLWSEGLFLRTQHFQQQDRHTEFLVRGALQAG